MRARLRGGTPQSLTGRIVVGATVFLVLGGATAAALAARSYLLHDDRFVIPASAQIQTQGNLHLTRAQLLSVFGADVERNIFKVPLGERRADLERLPWVAHATVMRLLPNRIRVSVEERTPVAFVRQGSHIGLVDGSGVLLDMPEDAPGDPHYSFPVLTGLSAKDPLSTRAARMEIYHRFMKELDGAGQKISETLSEVDVSSPEDVKALIPSGGTDLMVHFGDEKFLERYRHFEEHLPEWKQQYPKLASVDMRYERQVVLEMQPGAGVPMTAPGEVSGNGPNAPAPAGKPDDRGAGSTVPSVATKAATRTPTHSPEAMAKAVMPKTVSHATASKPTSPANEKMFAALAAARTAEKAQSMRQPRGWGQPQGRQ